MKQFTLYLFILFSVVIITSSCNKGSDNANKPVINNNNFTTMLVSNTGTLLWIGNVLPTLAVGNVGDYFLDTANGLVYGPKTATSWGNGYSLAGPAGPTGNQGATGKPGSQIYSGSGVPASTLGVTGDYYFDETNYLLYGPKTATGWTTPISFVGQTGPQGPQGPAGGASNVNTDQFTVQGSDWLWNSQYVYETSSGSYTEYFTRYYNRANNSITAGVLDSGFVMVYFTPSPVNNPYQWAPLPYQFDSSFGFTYNYVYTTSVGQVQLGYYFIQTDASATLPTLSTYNDETRQFKIISVTGKTGKFMTANHVNLNNYQEVAKITGIWQQDIKNQK